jgi:hypothetical protein
LEGAPWPPARPSRWVMYSSSQCRGSLITCGGSSPCSPLVSTQAPVPPPQQLSSPSAGQRLAGAGRGCRRVHHRAHSEKISCWPGSFASAGAVDRLVCDAMPTASQYSLTIWVTGPWGSRSQRSQRNHHRGAIGPQTILVVGIQPGRFHPAGHCLIQIRRLHRPSRIRGLNGANPGITVIGARRAVAIVDIWLIFLAVDGEESAAAEAHVGDTRASTIWPVQVDFVDHIAALPRTPETACSPPCSARVLVVV